MPLVGRVHVDLVVVVVVWHWLLLLLGPEVVVRLVVVLVEVQIRGVYGFLALVNCILLQVVVVQVDHAAETVVFQLVQLDRSGNLGQVCLCQKCLLVLGLELLQVLITGLRVDFELL